MKNHYDKIVKIEGSDVHLLAIEITNIKKYVEELTAFISDSSWIQELDSESVRTYQHTVRRTTELLVEIFNGVENTVSKEIGEYIVSLSTQEALKKSRNHLIIPLSELWKSQVSGNDGFDFHTLTKCQSVNFGEAKYKKQASPYSRASVQVLEFVEKFKDDADLNHLKAILPAIGEPSSLERNTFCYTVGFSTNALDVVKVMNNTLKSKDVKKLISMGNTIFIVGVKIAS